MYYTRVGEFDVAKVSVFKQIGGSVPTVDALVGRASRKAAEAVVEMKQLEALTMRNRADVLADEIAPIYIDVMFLMRHEDAYQNGHEQFVAQEQELTEKKRELSHLLDEIRDFESALPAFEAFVKQFHWDS